MKSIKTLQRITTAMNDLTTILNKISLTQFSFLSTIGFIFYVISKHSIASAFIICGITFSIYTQLIKLSTNSKIMIFLGFPIRLLIATLICAILVHKFHPDLLALFIGFALSQVIYITLMWQYAKANNKQH